LVAVASSLRIAKNQNAEIVERNRTGELGRAVPALQVE
jgi:hypothetical protein